ncbi:MAG: PAS domain S-box protein, partial [Ignavibacteriae bacterium]|nr:PAS domain S-box protein [Ignavibacteriota bacterium]
MKTIKKKEKKEISLEESYRNLFNTVSEAIYILNEDGVFIDVNKGAIEMYGYSREEFIGKTPVDVSAPGKNDLEQTFLLLKEAFNGKTQKFEFWGQRKNGEIFPKDIILNKGVYLGKVVTIATARDITDRKKAESEIARIQSRLALIFKNYPDIVLYESNGPNDFISDNVINMLGYPPYLFVENVKFINSIVHPDYTKNIEKKIHNWFDN